MPPPKKPKNKTQWDEFIWLIKEEETPETHDQAPAYCRSQSTFASGRVFEVLECSDVPEDLSQKTVEYRNARQNVAQNGLNRTFPAIPKETRESTVGKEHPRLRNILLGAADSRISLEALDCEEPERIDHGADPCSGIQRPPSFPRTVWSHRSPEGPSRVALPSYSNSRWTGCPDDPVDSEGDWCGRTSRDGPAQIETDGQNFKTGKIHRRSYWYNMVHDVDSHDSPREFNRAAIEGKVEGSMSDVLSRSSTGTGSLIEVSRLESQILADSTTNPAFDFNQIRRIRMKEGAFLAGRPREVHMPLSIRMDSQADHTQGQQTKAGTGGSLPSPVMRDAPSGGCERIGHSSPKTFSNVAHHQGITNSSIERSLKLLLGDEIVLPPGEDFCNDRDDSGATKRIRTDASKDRSSSFFALHECSESQENEKLAVSSADYSSSPELPSSSCLEMMEKSAEDKVCRCQICDDVASGFHYGVWSCEGCKAFFKRSLHGPVDYICPSTNNCTIDKLRRKSCQACRLRKCHEAGMTAGKSRREKELRAVGKKRKSCELEQNISEPEMARCYNVGSSHDISHQKFSAEVGTSKETRHLQSLQNQRRGNKSTDQINSFIDRLVAIELPPRLAKIDLHVTDPKLQLLTGLLGLMNCQLVDIICWSKLLPDFCHSSLELQTRLLVTSWPELIILGTAWQSLPHPNTWVCAPNLHLTRAQCQMTLIEKLYTQVTALVQTFQRLQLTQVELVLLRLTILLNSNVDAVESEPPLANLRSMLDEAWLQIPTDVTKSSRSRITHLLLTLPNVRQCSLLLRDLVKNVRHHDGIPTFELLHEMLDVDHDFAETRMAVAETTSME